MAATTTAQAASAVVGAGAAALPHQRASVWHSYQAIAKLGELQLLRTPEGRSHYGSLVAELQIVLEGWHARWGGAPEWQTFMNRKSFLHEVEEAIVPLSVLLDHVTRREATAGAVVAGVAAAGAAGITTTSAAADKDSSAPPGLLVYDLCSGKGFFAMLLTYLAASDREPFAALRRHVRGIVMAEKNKRVRWEHIEAANLDCRADRTSQPARMRRAVIPIELWRGANIHDHKFEQRLAGHAASAGISAAVLIGIHLCRRLSSRFVEIVNLLSAALAPPGVAVAVLAPCCLPGFKGAITVRTGGGTRKLTTEEPAAKTKRIDDARRERWNACWLCGDPGHAKRDCPQKGRARDTGVQLRAERLRALNERLRDAQLGLVQTASLPSSASAAIDACARNTHVVLDAGVLAAAANPFVRWCEFLQSAFTCVAPGTGNRDVHGGDDSLARGQNGAQLSRIEVCLGRNGANGHTDDAQATAPGFAASKRTRDMADGAESERIGKRARPVDEHGTYEVVHSGGHAVQQSWNSKRKTTWLVLHRL